MWTTVLGDKAHLHAGQRQARGRLNPARKGLLFTTLPPTCGLWLPTVTWVGGRTFPPRASPLFKKWSFYIILRIPRCVLDLSLLFHLPPHTSLSHTHRHTAFILMWYEFCSPNRRSFLNKENSPVYFKTSISDPWNISSSTLSGQHVGFCLHLLQLFEAE